MVGLRRGTVVRVTAAGVWVRLPVDGEVGPLSVVGGAVLAAGDSVAVGELDVPSGQMIVVGRVG